MKLKGKIAIVTGASSGMGREIAMMFAEAGAVVIAVARRKERLDEIVLQAKDEHAVIVPVQADLSKDEELDKVVDTAVSQFGRVDILVNNAGVLDNMMPVGEVTDEVWDYNIRVNLTVPMKLTRACVLDMLRREASGCIVNVASIGGLQGGRSGAAYISSKHGLVGLTKNTAYMYADKGIRCNAICPGGCKTEMGIDPDKLSAMGREKATAGVGMMPRMGEPEEIADIALFLASSDSSFLNGAVITADAGWTAY